MTTLAAEAAFLLSIIKPLLLLAVVIPWAWVVGRLDKDADYFFLKRPLWGMAHIGAGMLGFGLMLLIPIFWVGLPLGIIVLAGEIAAYVVYRNQNVPETEKWTFDLDSFRKRTEEMRQASAQRSASLVLTKKDGTKLDVPTSNEPNYPAHMALVQGMDFALPRGAEQVTLSVDAEKARYTARVDGVDYPLEGVEPATAVRVIDYVKEAAGLDLDDRRRRQVAVMACEHSEFGRHALEVIASGSTRGLALKLIIDPGAQVGIPVEKLGFTKPQLERIKAMTTPDEKGGVVIISGPESHGITTTLYSLLQSHDPYTSGVMTWEDEIVFEVEGVDHNVIPPGTPADKFNEKLNVMLRSEPDVLMLSRLADTKTADVCVKNAEVTRFYLPVAGSDTFSVLKKWLKAVGEPRRVARGTRAIIAQRLVRKLCPTCRQAYKPDAEALRKLNISADKVDKFYRASGKVVDEKGNESTCPTCLGMGYRGRTGVFEVMDLDDQARRLIAANDADRLRAHLRKNKMLWLQEAGLAKVVEGVTDIKEITRAMSEGKDKDKGKK